MKNIQKIVSFLVNPKAAKVEPQQRRQAQFVSVIIIITLPLGFIAEIIRLAYTQDWDSFYLYLAGSIVLLIIYFLNRSRLHRLTPYLLTFLSAILIFLMASIDPPQKNDVIYYLIFPIILGVFFFPFSQSLLFTTLVLGSIIFYGILFPVIPMRWILTMPFSFLFLFSVTLYILKSYRGVVERDQTRDLSEQESRYRSLLEATYEGIVSQVNGKVIGANAGFYHLFGYNHGEIIGKDVTGLFSDDEKENLSGNSNRILDGNREALMLKKDGTVFPAEITSHIQSLKNQLVEVIAIRDITVRKWSEETLQHAYDEMEHIVEDRTIELKLTNLRLQREVEERKEAEKLQAALYRISEAAYSVPKSQMLFPIIHTIISELIPAGNLYFAMYDRNRNEISFPYFVDEYDQAPPPRPLGNGPTDWVIRNGESLLLVNDSSTSFNKPSEISNQTRSGNWLGVPLKRIDGRTVGALVVQNYANTGTPGTRFSERDKSILDFVSSQVAMSIERQRAEYHLSQSEERFRSISEIATDFAYSYLVGDDEKLSLEWVTGALTSITGYSVEEVKQKESLEQTYISKSDLHLMKKRMKRLLANQVDISEVMIFTKNGERRYLRQVGRPVTDAVTGRVVRILCAAQDITERKQVEEELLKAHQELEQRVEERTTELASANESLLAKISELEEAEQALRQSENALRRIYNENKQLLLAIQTILIGVDSLGIISHWNSAATEILGLTADETIGISFFNLFVDWDWEIIRDGVSICTEKSEIIRINNVQFTRPEGEICFLDLTLSPLTDQERLQTGFLLLGVDITQRRVMEQQLAQMHKLESIGQLAAGIAHEINTPTQYVDSNLHFMAERVGDLVKMHKVYQQALMRLKETQTFDAKDVFEVENTARNINIDYILNEFPLAIEQSLNGVDRISHIVKAMREFSYPGTDKPTMADINRLIESTVEVSRNEWKYVANLNMELDPDLPMIECLPAEVNQVFLNIIINAVHAIQDVIGEDETEDKRGLIEVKTKSLGDQIEIKISDSGTGIPLEAQSRIFDPFFTTKEVGRGTGQGLSIAHNVVVNKHHGKIHFKTEIGKGTTFIINLPVKGILPAIML